MKIIRIISVLLSTLLLATFAYGQSKSEVQKEPVNSTQKAVKSLSKSLESSASDSDVARNYIALAKQLSAAGDYTKAEDYLRRAIKLYEKTKEREPLASTQRELGRVLEMQNKREEAAASYSDAAKTTRDKVQQQMNTNDANRLKNYADVDKRTSYIQSNINLTESAEANDMVMEREAVVAYQNMAEAKRASNDKEGEIVALGSAVKAASKSVAPEAIRAKQDLVEALAQDEQLEMAMEVRKEIVEDAKVSLDTKVQIEQLQSLSTMQSDAHQPEEAISSLEEAYDLSVKGAQTLEARNSVRMLVEQYAKERNTKKALETYADFMDRLEGLIREDSTLVDEQMFSMQEDKILQLEKERELKDELLKKKNRFNYALLGSVGLAAIFMMLITQALYSIKRKNKRIALQSLRREMNPHFIFNSLNSVNQFIAQNNELEANKYLSAYSKLMRNIMENSNKDFISLSAEMEQMKKYLELEHMRFSDKFDYHITVDPEIDAESMYVPNMLIQPQLENAVWHGLRYREAGGVLELTVRRVMGQVCVTIEDNGIGLTKSKELKTKHQSEHNSRGMTNTRERIELLNALYHTTITISVSEKKDPETGVVVELCFPMMDRAKVEKER